MSAIYSSFLTHRHPRGRDTASSYTDRTGGISVRQVDATPLSRKLRRMRLQGFVNKTLRRARVDNQSFRFYGQCTSLFGAYYSFG
jgi:hypothetical protein